MTDIGRKMSENREGALNDQGDHIEIPQVAHKDDQSLPPRFDQMQIQEDSKVILIPLEDSAIEDQSQANHSSHPQLAGRTSSTSQQRFAVHSLTNLRSDTNSKGQGIMAYPDQMQATQDLVVTNMMMDNSITLQQIRQESGTNSEMLNTNLYCQQMATVLRSSKQQSGIGSKLEQPTYGIKVQDFPRIEDFDGGKFKRQCCNYPHQNANGVMNSNDHDVFSKAESLNHSLVKFDQSIKPPLKGKKKNKGPEGFQHRQFFSNVAGNNKSTALRKYKSTHPGLYCLTPPKEQDREHEDTLAELNQLENGDITGNSLQNTLATRKIVSTNRTKQPTRSGLSKNKKPQSGKRSKKNATTNMSLGAKRVPLAQKQQNRKINKTSSSSQPQQIPVHTIREIQELEDTGTVEKTKEDLKSSDRVLEFDVQAAYNEYQIKENEDEKNEIYKYKLDRSYNISRAIEGELSPSHLEKQKKAEQVKKVNFVEGQDQFVGIKQKEASLVRSSSARARGTIGIGSKQENLKNGGRRMTGRAIWGHSNSLSNVHGISSGGMQSLTDKLRHGQTEIALQHKKLVASHSKNKSQRQILLSNNTNALIQGLNDISHSLLDNNLSRSPQQKRSDQPITATLYGSGKRSRSKKISSKQHSREISNRIQNSLYQTDELINGPSKMKLIQEVQNPQLVKVNENNSEYRTISQDFQSTLKRGPGGSPDAISNAGTFKCQYPKSATGKAVISLIPLQKHTNMGNVNQTGLDGTQRLMRDSAVDQLNEHDKIIIDEGLQASREAVDRHLNAGQAYGQGEANASYNDISMHGQVSVMEPIRKTAHHSGGKNQSSTPSITPGDGEVDGEFEIPQSPKTRPTARYDYNNQDPNNSKAVFKTENVTHTFEYKINLAGSVPEDSKTRNVMMPDTQFKSEPREYDESFDAELDRESPDTNQSGVYEPIKSKQDEIKPILSNKSKVSGIHRSILSPQNDSKSGNRYKKNIRRNDKNTDSGTEIPIPDRDDFETPSLNHNVYENSEQDANRGVHSTGSPKTREKVLIKNQNMTSQYGTLIEQKDLDQHYRQQSYAEQYKSGKILANTAGQEQLMGLLNRTVDMNTQKTINVSRPGTATQLDKNQICQINSKYGGSYQKRSFTKSPDVNSPQLKYLSGNQLAIVPNIIPDSRLARSLRRVQSSCKNDEFSVAEMSAQVMLDQNEGVTEGSQGLNLIPTGFYIQSPSGNFNIPNFAADRQNDVIYEHTRGESKDSGFGNLDLEQVFREAIAQHEANTNKLIDQNTKMNILKYISLHQDAIIREQVQDQTIPQLRYNQKHLVEGPQSKQKENYQAFRRQEDNDIYLRHRQNDKLFHQNKHDFMIQGKKLITIKNNLRQQQIFQYLQKQIALAQGKQLEQQMAQGQENNANKFTQKKTSVEVNINGNLIEKFEQHLMPSISSGANIHSEQMIHSTRRTVTLNPKQSLQQSITGRQGKILQVYSSINTTHNRGLNAISGAGVPAQISPTQKFESQMRKFQASLISSNQATVNNLGSQKVKQFNLGSSSDSKGQLSPSSNSLGGVQNTTQLIQMTTEGRIDETINAQNPNLQLLAEQSLQSARRLNQMPLDSNGNPFLNIENYPHTIDQQSAFAKQMTSSAVSNSGHYGMAGEGVLQSPRMQHDLRASTAYSGKDGPLKITDGANMYNNIRNSQESQNMLQISAGFVDQSKTEINDARNSGENVEFIREYHGPQDLYQPPSDRGKQLYSATPDLPDTFTGKDKYLYIQGKRQSQELTCRGIDNNRAQIQGDTQPVIMNIDNQEYNINKQEFFPHTNDTFVEESQTANRTMNQTATMHQNLQQQDANPYLNQNQIIGDMAPNSDRQQVAALPTVSGEQVLPQAFHTLSVKKDVQLKYQEDHKSPATLDMHKRITTSNMKASLESNQTKQQTINESEPNVSSYHITKPKLHGETTSVLDEIIGQSQIAQGNIKSQDMNAIQNIPIDHNGTFMETQFVSGNVTPNNLSLIKPTHLERKKLLSNLSNETALLITDKIGSGKRQAENNSETVDVKSLFQPRSLRAKIDLHGNNRRRNEANQKVALSSSQEQIVIEKSKSKLMSKIGKMFVNDKFKSMAQTVSDRMREGHGLKQATIVRPRSSQIEKGGSTPHTASITVSVIRQIPSDNQDLIMVGKDASDTHIKTSQTFRIGSDANRTFSRNPDIQQKGIQSATQFENQAQTNTLQNSMSHDRVSTFIKHQHLEKIQKGEVWLKGSTVKTNSDLQEVESQQVRKMNIMDQINDQAEIDEKDETIVDEALEQMRQDRESDLADKMLVRLNSQSQKQMASIENLPEIQEVSGSIHLHKSKTIARNAIFDETKTQANINLLKTSKLCNRLNKGPGGEAANLIGSIPDAKSRKSKSRSSKMIPSQSQAMYVIKKPSENDQSASRLIENSKVLQEKAKIVKGKRINSAIQMGILRSSYQYDGEQEKGVITGGGRVAQPMGLVTKKPESIRTGTVSAYDCCTGLKSGAVSSKTNKMRRLRSAGRATGIGTNENTSAVKESQNHAQYSQDPSNYWAGATINNQIDVGEDEFITSDQDYFANKIRPGTAKVSGISNGLQGRFSIQKKISPRNIQKQRIESAHHPIQQSYGQGLYNSTGFVDNTTSLKILQPSSPKSNALYNQTQKLQNQGLESGMKSTQYGNVRIMSRTKMVASKTQTTTFGPKEGFVSVDQMSHPGTEKMMAQTQTMKNQDLLQSGLAHFPSNKAPIWMLNANRMGSSVTQVHNVQQKPEYSRTSNNHMTQQSMVERNSSNQRFAGPSYFYKTNAESVFPSANVQKHLNNGDLSIAQQFYQSESQITHFSQVPSQISRPSMSRQTQLPKRRGGSLSQVASINNYSVMRARRKLQKGTTFKDENFEAKRKDGSRGLVI